MEEEILVFVRIWSRNRENKILYIVLVSYLANKTADVIVTNFFEESEIYFAIFRMSDSRISFYRRRRMLVASIGE